MVELETAFVDLVGGDPVIQALAAGVIIATMNLVGALAVVVWRDPSERALDGALGFAAGVMLSASYTSLILPGIEYGGVFPVVVGFFLGVALLDFGDSWVPHVQAVITGRRFEDVRRVAPGFDSGGEDTGESTPRDGAGGTTRADEAGADGDGDAVSSARVGSVVLFIVAITIHNMPEGLAVGVGFGSAALPDATTGIGDALALMLAIGIQNVPEGLAVSVAARNAGLGTYAYAAVAGARAGLVEIPLCVFGAVAVGIAAPVLPYAMGFAAGGMLFVISHEIVPQTHSRGNEHVATIWMMIGVVVMLYLDVALA